MTFDLYANTAPSRTPAAEYAVAVTPSDDVPLPFPTSYLIVGGAGELVAVMKHPGGGTTDITYTVVAGQVLVIRTMFIKTGTTATGIVAHH